MKGCERLYIKDNRFSAAAGQTVKFRLCQRIEEMIVICQKLCSTAHVAPGRRGGFLQQRHDPVADMITKEPGIMVAGIFAPGKARVRQVAFDLDP